MDGVRAAAVDHLVDVALVRTGLVVVDREGAA